MKTDRYQFQQSLKIQIYLVVRKTEFRGLIKLLKMLNLNRFIQFFSILIIVNSCSSGSGSSNETSSPELVISYSNLNNLKSYELVNLNINSNLNCEFNIASNDIYWVKTTNNKNFLFRAPVTMQVNEIKSLTITSISSSECLSLKHI